jgi:hypothetical protein
LYLKKAQVYGWHGSRQRLGVARCRSRNG